MSLSLIDDTFKVEYSHLLYLYDDINAYESKIIDLLALYNDIKLYNFKDPHIYYGGRPRTIDIIAKKTFLVNLKYVIDIYEQLIEMMNEIIHFLFVLCRDIEPFSNLYYTEYIKPIIDFYEMIKINNKNIRLNVFRNNEQHIIGNIFSKSQKKIIKNNFVLSRRNISK